MHPDRDGARGGLARCILPDGPSLWCRSFRPIRIMRSGILRRLSSVSFQFPVLDKGVKLDAPS
jgi:hypothetical protein